MKKLLIVILLSSLAVLSCGKKSGKKQIRYQYWDVNYNETFNALKKAFEEKNSDIEVIAEVIPWAQYWAKLQAAASGGDMADIFWMNFPNTPRYMASSLMADLSDVANAPEVQTYVKNFPDAAKEVYAKNGKYYVFPKGMDSIVCYINTKILSDNGIAIPNENWTIEDLVKIGETLQPKLPKGSHVFSMELSEQTGYLPFIYNMGGYMLKNGTDIGLDKPESIKGMQLYSDIMNSKWARDPLSEAPIHEDYLAGRAAILQYISIQVYGINKDPELLKNTIILPIPKVNGQNKGTFHAVGDAVFSKSKNKEEAVKWMIFMNSPEGLEIQAKVGIFFPLQEPYISIHAGNLGFSKESIGAITYMADNSFPYPSTLEFAKFYQTLDGGVKSMVQDKKDVPSQIKAMTAEMRTFLK